MEQTLNLSLREVAALLQKKAYVIEYALAHGLVREPQVRVAGRRVFSAEDIANLRAHFETKRAAAKSAAEPAVAGV